MSSGGKRNRLDQILLDQGFASTRTKAQALIRAGLVRVDGVLVDKPGTAIGLESAVEVTPPPPFVSRGGFKLVAALDAFGFDPAGLRCLDIGASTGGFTDVLLQRGASQVYAVDVGYGQLDDRLRKDSRVTSMERTNIRELAPQQIDAPVDACVIDVSFISLRTVIPLVPPLIRRGEGWVAALIKPQFEVGRKNVGKGGIVKDEAARQAAVATIEGVARESGFAVVGVIPSPIKGAKGNIEFLIGLTI